MILCHARGDVAVVTGDLGGVNVTRPGFELSAAHLPADTVTLCTLPPHPVSTSRSDARAIEPFGRRLLLGSGAVLVHAGALVGGSGRSSSRREHR